MIHIVFLATSTTTNRTYSSHQAQRDPAAPVHVGKATVARALLERVAALSPSFSCVGEDGEEDRCLVYFRWLAHSLGPVPAASDAQRWDCLCTDVSINSVSLFPAHQCLTPDH